ncbi:WSC domain-containing protein [Ascobolus immersus RN42]|uniref:WSC domain-containing protein n=1 Tax=Ascobolus immersus RN42 TaxID=1160509 RepID=A0A3N4IM82_ASCIM|nr:WSC domain-containing protein [Ascobolus immersus RN42]
MLFKSFIASVGLAILTFVPHATAFWRMPCEAPVLIERSDPIVNPGQVSSHLHTIMGPNSFDFTMSYDDARKKATCSTCRVEQDRSAYWTPNLWFKAQNGSFTPVPQVGGGLIYYMQRRHGTEKVHAFPPGFRMLAGNPMVRSFKNTQASKAISYACIDTVRKPETRGFPKGNCDKGLRLQVFFPSCWDGKNTDSVDHKSHMAYPSDVDNGFCPTTHPKRVISLFYEIMFDVNSFVESGLWKPNNDFPFVLSNGDGTGFGSHADFLNGWDQKTLQTAIDTCTNSSGDFADCPVFKRISGEAAKECMLTKAIAEKTSGWLPALPGCNPVTYGPADAKPGNCGVQKQAVIGPREKLYSDMSHLGFEYLGCVVDSIFARTFPERTWDDKMTIDMCINKCTEKGFPMAGVQYANECYCGTRVPKERLGMQRCLMPCVGDSKQICGGQARMSVYKKKGYVAKRVMGMERRGNGAVRLRV